MGTDGYARKLHELLPRIRARREEIEEARRLPRDLVQELSATGIFRLGVPAAYGGDEADPLDLMRVIETVSAADGSTGWCTMIALDAAVTAGMTPETGVKEVFEDLDAPKAEIVPPAGTAVPADGGVVVSGRWRFASGITHADWVMAGCIVVEDGRPRMTPHGPEILHAWLPVGAIEIHDTWHVNGLRGTGSCDFTVEDLFVPAHRTFNAFDPSSHRPEPLVQMPLASVFAAREASVGIGIARAALDEVAELAQTKVPSLSPVPLAQKPLFQIELARAEAELGSARAYLYESIEDLWQSLLAGRRPTIAQIGVARMAAVRAAETAADVARRANLLAGATSVFSSSSLQRHARDADTVAHHFIVSPHTWEDAGRVLLGLDPLTPVF